MKRAIIVLLAFLGILSSGCKKSWVDTKPNGAPANIYLWTSATEVQLGVNAIYRHIRDESNFGRNLFFMQNGGDDQVVGLLKIDADNIKNFICTGREPYMAQAWSDLYWTINTANEVIAGIKTATDVSDSLKNRSLGEAYFIRAFTHFWVAYLWGSATQGVPFMGVEDPDYGKKMPPQLPTVMANYAQVISDLTKAASLLPYFESYGSADQGRAHKVACWAYMVKTYAYWAQYDATKWALVPALCDSIRDYGNRALITGQDTPADNYKAVFKIAGNWSSEYIWSITSSGTQNGSEFPGAVLESSGWGVFGGYGYFQPTEELYDEYEPSDPRRDATILNFGDVFTYFGVPRAYYSTNSPSGFQLNKYMEPFTYGSNDIASTNPYVNSTGDPSTSLNVPILRYAEIVLFKAEALIQMGRSADAAVPLNEIRARVGLAPIANPTMADLKHERRCELGGEWYDRLADLKRWGDFDMIRAPLHGRIHTNKTDPNSPYTIQVVWPARTFTVPKDLVWPISPDEIEKSNGLYKQNTGW